MTPLNVDALCEIFVSGEAIRIGGSSAKFFFDAPEDFRYHMDKQGIAYIFASDGKVEEATAIDAEGYAICWDLEENGEWSKPFGA